MGLLHKTHNLKSGSGVWFLESFILRCMGSVGAGCSASSQAKGFQYTFLFLCLASFSTMSSSTRETWSSNTEAAIARLLRQGLALSGGVRVSMEGGGCLSKAPAPLESSTPKGI